MAIVPTQKELAKVAGVSAGTVSNVINGFAGVSDSARKKVLAAIEQLNYQPNLIARSLRTNRSQILGIVVPDITIAFYPRLIRGAEAAARDAGYFLTVLDSENDYRREGAMLALLHSQRSEGTLLVAAGGHKWTKEASEQLQSSAPLVCVDRLPEGLTADSVCVDDAAAARMAVVHLLQMGHRNIAVLTGPLTLRNEQERLRGYKHALQQFGIPVNPELIWTSSFHQSDVDRLCQRGLLSSAKRPTALFTTNGAVGMGALKSIYALGLQTPADIAFVTFDELMSEDFFRPGITTVLQPAYDIGSRATQVLLKRIRGGGDGAKLESVRLPATLIVRESSSTPLAASPAPVRTRKR
jgi:LacI family transcriptional regulator